MFHVISYHRISLDKCTEISTIMAFPRQCPLRLNNLTIVPAGTDYFLHGESFHLKYDQLRDLLTYYG